MSEPQRDEIIIKKNCEKNIGDSGNELPMSTMKMS